jgi:hypothetical protein
MAADVFLRGHGVPAGTVLGSKMAGTEDRQEKEKEKEEE